MNEEGTIRFWLRHQDENWETNNNFYDFGIVNKTGITVQAAKYTDKTVEFKVSGPRGQFYYFRDLLPPCDYWGLCVHITWNEITAKLYLNGKYVSETTDLFGKIKNTNKQVMGTVGRCIYCGDGNSPLTDEHIVPFGLNGSWVLNEASCKDCAKVTSRFELDVLRHHLKTSRTTLGFRTRHPKKRSSEFSVSIEKEGEQETVDIPAGKFPALMIMPIFPEPSHLTKQPYNGNQVTDWWFTQVGGFQGDEIRSELNISEFGFDVRIIPFSFAQLLAKIAYGMVIAEFGVTTIEEAYILPSILGTTNDIGRWVGSAGEKKLPYQNIELHKLAMNVSIESREVVCRLSLFSVFGAPEYLVAVGKVTKDALSGFIPHP